MKNTLSGFVGPYSFWPAKKALNKPQEIEVALHLKIYTTTNLQHHHKRERNYLYCMQKNNQWEVPLNQRSLL